MSDIFGKGYGDSHDWQRGYTRQSKGTDYQCRACGETFIHWYDQIPNIFEALQAYGASEVCPKRSLVSNVGKEGEEKR